MSTPSSRSERRASANERTSPSNIAASQAAPGQPAKRTTRQRSAGLEPQSKLHLDQRADPAAANRSSRGKSLRAIPRSSVIRGQTARISQHCQPMQEPRRGSPKRARAQLTSSYRSRPPSLRPSRPQSLHVSTPSTSRGSKTGKRLQNFEINQPPPNEVPVFNQKRSAAANRGYSKNDLSPPRGSVFRGYEARKFQHRQLSEEQGRLGNRETSGRTNPHPTKCRC